MLKRRVQDRQWVVVFHLAVMSPCGTFQASDGVRLMSAIALASSITAGWGLSRNGVLFRASKKWAEHFCSARRFRCQSVRQFRVRLQPRHPDIEQYFPLWYVPAKVGQPASCRYGDISTSPWSCELNGCRTAMHPVRCLRSIPRAVLR